MDPATGWGQYGSSKRYQTGDYIFEEGEPADHVYVITTGRVAITKNTHTDTQLVLGYVGAGEMLGEVAMWTNERRTAAAMAAEPLELLAISREDFWRLFDEDWAFRHLITNELIRHILAADQSRLAAAATERTLSTLIELRQATTRFIVHDLQNPLNLIMMALSMVESDPSFDAGSEMAEYTATAKSSVSRMLTLVESLLDTERLSDSNYALDTTSVDLIELANEIVIRNHTIAQHKEIELTVEQPDAPIPNVKIDQQRIDRVITNLIDNALKFTPPEGRVWIDFRQTAGSVVVGVNDTGPGIPPEQRQQVFERFMQTEASRKTRRGFGLGLAYCQLAVQMHGGTIWVEEGSGGSGTRFAFSLPCPSV
jgi:signal transduction histidine kinase